MRSSSVYFICNRYCDESLPALNHLDYYSGRQRTALRDKARLVTNPQWVSGFLSHCFWKFPDQLGNTSELVVQKKFIKFRQSTQKAWLRPAEFFRKVLSGHPFNLFIKLVDIYWAFPGSSVFCDWLFLVSCVSLGTALIFFYSSMLPWFWWKQFVSCEDWNDFFKQRRQSRLIMREKFQRKKTLIDFKNEYNTKGYNFI